MLLIFSFGPALFDPDFVGTFADALFVIFHEALPLLTKRDGPKEFLRGPAFVCPAI